MTNLGYPFTLGVASGEPLPDSVIIWTRLAPEPLGRDPRRPGGMPGLVVPVRWQVAEDEGFRRIVRQGTAQADRRWAHSVHVKVDGLRPGGDYFYRFSVGAPFAATTSPAGRTRTAPAAGAATPVRFAFVSCQRYEHGHFTALRHLADERPDVVLQLGDYIYEYGRPADPGPGRYVRRLEAPEEACQTLQQYRNRYARYRTDPDLQAAHRAAPWIATWDDHEVRDNYRGALPGDGSDPAVFRRRRAAAYQAYYEHLPLRVRPSASGLQMHRWRPYGRAADFLVLDVRQYRTAATMLGTAQEEWLLARLAGSAARWKVLVQPLFFSRRFVPGPPPNLRADAWDGYPEFRRRVTGAGVRGLVVIAGDVHNAWAGELRADFADPASAPAGVELVGSSVTSMPPATDSAAVLAANPHLRFFDGRRGYVVCTAGVEGFHAAYRAVDFVDRPGSPVRTAAGFGVRDDRLVPDAV
ncbi:alkaline phosphatase D family protein [Planomonospora sp. ID67723]|uniref:alkaline phosphatase D family protein n=1 Tax=Planomonospora sp. ID67723 TaxID=2738134 RepID=UPI0018C37947|nr:alkaline phosphatase D family protein [Planomonospora sp. ID67723]MBG0828733.1 alkaline phosphatase D family protein [Planomonospora sp. ID67723]